MQKVGVTSMTIYQGRAIDAVTYIPVSSLNFTISPGPILDFNTQSSLRTDANG